MEKDRAGDRIGDGPALGWRRDRVLNRRWNGRRGRRWNGKMRNAHLTMLRTRVLFSIKRSQ